MAGVLALGVAFVAPIEDYGASVAEDRVRIELRRLATLAGIRSEQGDLARAIEVRVEQDGDPSWVHEGVAGAIDDEPSFRPGAGPHRLRVSAVGQERGATVQLALERQGWRLRLPQPVEVQCRPALVVLAILVGLMVHGVAPWPGLGALAAGLVAQIGAGSGVAAWREGMAYQHLAQVLAVDSVWVDRIGVGVTVLSLLLVAFDVRRSARRSSNARKAGRRALMGGVLTAVGSVAWLEAACRIGGPGFARSTWGVIVAVLLAGAWAGMVNAESWRLILRDARGRSAVD